MCDKCTHRLSDKEKTELFTNIGNMLKDAGLAEFIVYTVHGAITFGNPAKVFAMYLHVDKAMNEEVIPDIIEQIPEDVVNRIVQHMHNEQHHFHTYEGHND